MLLPLAIGLFLNRRFPRVAARLQPIVSKIGNLGLVIGLIAVLALHWRALLGTFGNGAFAASIVLVAGGLLAGWLISGADTAARPVLTLGTGARNIPAALVVADRNFADPEVLVMCVLVALVSLVRPFRRGAAAGPRRAGAVPADGRLIGRPSGRLEPARETTLPFTRGGMSGRDGVVWSERAAATRPRECPFDRLRRDHLQRRMQKP